MGISWRFGLLLAAAVAVVGLVAPAGAATINLGSIDQPTSVAISGQSNTYVFTVNDPATFTATVTDSGSSSLVVDLLEVYDLSGPHGVTFDTWLTTTPGGLLTFTKSVGVVTGHLYLLIVDVNPLDSPGGYSGSLQFQFATAVTPIPPAMLMFGTALAGLGALRWRRRRADPGA